MASAVQSALTLPFLEQSRSLRRPNPNRNRDHWRRDDRGLGDSPLVVLTILGCSPFWHDTRLRLLFDLRLSHSRTEQIELLSLLSMFDRLSRMFTFGTGYKFGRLDRLELY